MNLLKSLLRKDMAHANWCGRCLNSQKRCAVGRALHAAYWRALFSGTKSEAQILKEAA
jgi:hypothetical protein